MKYPQEEYLDPGRHSGTIARDPQDPQNSADSQEIFWFINSKTIVNIQE